MSSRSPTSSPACPGYDYVDTGVIGTDAIRVGIIYRADSVTPVGDHAVLDTQAFVNPRGADLDRNRPAVAQTFEENATGSRFTVVVNHLKSKGSGCGAGDDDTTTGQGNCNLTRTLAASGAGGVAGDRSHGQRRRRRPDHRRPQLVRAGGFRSRP